MSKYMSLPSFILKEKFNIHKANKLLHTDLLDDETKAGLKKYMKYSANGFVKVRYTPNEIGRLTIRIDTIKTDKEGNPKDTCRSQYNMYNIVKATICHNVYDDLDVVNCHPTLLLQIFNSKGYRVKTLQKFIDERDAIFHKFKQNGISRERCKELFMSIFYGGKIDTWKRNNEVKALPELFYKLEKEMVKNRDKLLLEDDMVKYVIEAENRKGKDGFNLKGSALSYYIQTEESNVLLCMYKWLSNNNYRVGALIHDGLHIEKFIDDYSRDMCICLLQEEILKETGFTLELKVKPFKVPEEVNNIITVGTDQQGGILVTEKIKKIYVECNGRKFMKVNDVWITDEKKMKEELTRIISQMDIYFDVGGSISPYSTMSQGNSNILKFVYATEDVDFMDKLFYTNLGKLCFKNGYWNFSDKKFCEYDDTIYTAVKINNDYTPSTEENRQAVYDKILNPIFANNFEMRDSWLNTTARALAGDIEDKNWVVCMGERDCGKGVLVGMLEKCFGNYCRATNGENFVFKNTIGDSAKSLSWLIPFEFKRLILTNEITRDGANTYRINGNILKKLASGGDKIEARLNHKDEINFVTQARPMIFCNDLPPIEPADAKETAYIYYFPSKFIDDERVGTQILNDENGEIIISYHKKDDDIKYWSKSSDIVNAFVDILFNNYSDKLPLPKSMDAAQKDFKEAESEYTVLDEILSYKGDPYDGWDAQEGTIKKVVSYDDVVPTKQLKYIISKKNINMSPQKYNKYITSRGGVKTKVKKDGKTSDGWRFLRLNDDNE